MSATIIKINPYHSVRYLKKLVKITNNIPHDIRLVVNSRELKDNETLIKYLHENAIIHLLKEYNVK